MSPLGKSVIDHGLKFRGNQTVRKANFKLRVFLNWFLILEAKKSSHHDLAIVSHSGT